MMIVDTHCHASHNWFEPVETLVHVMDMDEVDHALLLQHRGTPITCSSAVSAFPAA